MTGDHLLELFFPERVTRTSSQNSVLSLKWFMCYNVFKAQLQWYHPPFNRDASTKSMR